jgi:hypothetical protein
MDKFKYSGFTFMPYGNIIGKDNETRFQRLMWRLDTLNPLINTENGYNYEEFNETAGENSADIYFAEETKRYYVPIRGGLCSIDIKEMKKYIKKIK